MKTNKINILLTMAAIGAIVIFTGCGSTKVCKIPGVDNAKFNYTATDKVGTREETLSFRENNNVVTRTYKVPVIVGTKESWEDSYGSRVTVEK